MLRSTRDQPTLSHGAVGQPRAAGGRHPRQRGIALVIVLWVVALLTVMALGLTTAQRTESALTQNQLDDARFRALADAAVQLVVLDLLSVPVDMLAEEQVLIPDGQPRPLRFDGETLRIALFNEASRIDLNTATRDQLAALLQIAGADEIEQAQIADAILDWRDEDDLSLLNGAEDPDYEKAGRPYGAADGPFHSVEELQQVLGMTPALYRRLAPDLTVDSSGAGGGGIPLTTTSTSRSRTAGGLGVDLSFASAAVLAAMQGISLDDARLVVEERNQPVTPDAQQARVVQRGGPLYRIRVEWMRGARASRSMEALIELQAGASPPFETRWRRYGLAASPPPPP